VKPFVSRGGHKLDHALEAFGISAAGLACADLGCSTGGFVDCLLKRQAAKVYAIDTGYGVLDYTLRKDPRVVVMERTNAMHAQLPEPVSLITIDVAWTRQRRILPAAARLLAPGGCVVSLIKPHYEAEQKLLRRGRLPPELIPIVFPQVASDITSAGFCIVAVARSPITGTGGNVELLAWLTPLGGEGIAIGAAADE
jgi:23S rRNA (cytidine1920-2'-O)/16S rRNA (cytidine1409-2'-O)-methyltransferase